MYLIKFKARAMIFYFFTIYPRGLGLLAMGLAFYFGIRYLKWTDLSLKAYIFVSILAIFRYETVLYWLFFYLNRSLNLLFLSLIFSVMLGPGVDFIDIISLAEKVCLSLGGASNFDTFSAPVWKNWLSNE